MTFETFANEWLEYYGTQVKVSSVRARRIAMKHLVSSWGHLPLRKITKHMYQSRINNLSKGFSQNYIDSIHTTGNMIFKHAIRQDLIKTNPTYGFVMPKKHVTVEDIEEDEVKGKFLELNELKTFLRITKEQGLYLDYLCFATLAYTGMRLGEMLALKWTELDLTKKTIRITKTYYNPNNKSTGYQLLTPKTKKSIRTIMIDDGLVALFKAHKSEQMELKMKQRLVYENQDFIFAENIGHPRVMKQVVLRLQRLMKHLDVDKHITPHSFRHTHTSLLIEAGAGVKEIQERLGHSDINTTMNIYAHMTKNIEEKTFRKFSELTKGLL
nr:site-specific integrase [Peribacillus sp. Bi134]